MNFFISFRFWFNIFDHKIFVLRRQYFLQITIIAIKISIYLYNSSYLNLDFVKVILFVWSPIIFNYAFFTFSVNLIQLLVEDKYSLDKFCNFYDLFLNL